MGASGRTPVEHDGLWARPAGRPSSTTGYGRVRQDARRARRAMGASGRTPVEHDGLWAHRVRSLEGRLKTPYGVVLEFKLPSRTIASKQSMTDRRPGAAGAFGRRR